MRIQKATDCRYCICGRFLLSHDNTEKGEFMFISIFFVLGHVQFFEKSILFKGEPEFGWAKYTREICPKHAPKLRVICSLNFRNIFETLASNTISNRTPKLTPFQTLSRCPQNVAKQLQLCFVNVVCEAGVLL